MMNSKLVKLDFRYTTKDRIKAFFWPIYRVLRTLRRMYDWAVFSANNHDWDHGYLFDVMNFKLKRMEQAILHGHHVPDKATDQSLRLAIKLGEKLRTHEYSYFADLHSKKWGQLDFIETTNAEGRTHSGIGRPGVPPEKEEQETQESIEAYKKDDALRERDVRWFFSILAKYHQLWWD